MIEIEEHPDQKEEDVMKRIVPLAGDLGLSLEHVFSSESSRWQITKYGDGIGGKIAKIVKFGSNNIVSYNPRNDTVGILLRDNGIKEDVERLSVNLEKNGYKVKIEIGYIT